MRSSGIGQRFQKNINKCDVCFQSYNRSTRAPIIICGMHHTICKQCVAHLKYKPICPFCRQNIKFDKTVINNYIFELLPRQPNEAQPNIRREVERPAVYTSNNRGNLPSVSNNNVVNSYEPLRQEEDRYGNNQNRPGPNNNSVNNMPVQPVAILDRQPPRQINQQEQFIANYACLILAILMCFTIPFTITNLVFALTEPPSVCMDVPHGGLAVRPWFMGIAISDLALFMGMLVPIIFFKLGCCSLLIFGILQVLFLILFLVKGSVWFIVELVLYINGISKYCQGGVHTYGLFLVIFNAVNLCTGCCQKCFAPTQYRR